MTVESVKLILDAFAKAGNLGRFLPELPPGITGRALRVIDQIAILQKQNGNVRVSDISEVLDVTRPGITIVLSDLEAKGYISKYRNSSDNRVVYVALTEAGTDLYHVFIEEYHQHLSDILADIGDEGAEAFASMVRRILKLFSDDLNNQLMR